MIEVTYVDHMGSDLSVVNSARVSFGKKSEALGEVGIGDDPVMVPVLHDNDVRLIRYLAKHKHKSPFNHAFATFHVKAPIFVARQLVKHEYMPWNEISRRYVDDEPEFYQPDVWRGRSDDKKQGSDGVVDVGKIGDVSLASKTLYNSLLDRGVCPEQARMVLPQSMMTEWYWSGSLFAFAKMCGLRLKDDTQYETRLVAQEIEDYMMDIYPNSWEALRMYDDE
jgi:thymidylate synthase (FAD)